MDFDISFHTVVGQRGAYRAAIPGLTIRLADGTQHVANDLSAGGVGFSPPEGRAFHVGKEILLDILVADHLYIQGLECVIVRERPNAVACAFRGLSRIQETRLDKLVLETQKRLIARRKLEEDQREKANVTPQTPEGETHAHEVISINIKTK